MNPRACLVTGAGGFLGQHLVAGLRVAGMTVLGGVRRSGGTVPPDFVALDVEDSEEVSRRVAEFGPEVIYHLAAQSFPTRSWDEPARTLAVNVLGAVHILEAARRLEPAPTVVLVGSSAEYAPLDKGRPISEGCPQSPSSPYGVGKLAGDHLGRLYHLRYGLRVLRVRPFSLVGPGKRGDACADFARGIVAVERGHRDSLPVGNLEAVRDFLDVRDGVAALLTVAEKGQPGAVYNICRGQGCSLRTVLELFLARAVVPVTVRPDSSLDRPLDERIRIGDPAALRRLGWKPDVPLEQTVTDILGFWRSNDEVRRI